MTTSKPTPHCALCGRGASKADGPAGDVWYCQTCGTGDYVTVTSDKARQSAWAERDAERDRLLAWNEAAQAFKAVLS